MEHISIVELKKTSRSLSGEIMGSVAIAWSIIYFADSMNELIDKIIKEVKEENSD